MDVRILTLLILALPAAGALVLAGRGWRWPRSVTRLVGPGVVWAAFVCVAVLFFRDAGGDFTYWTWIRSGSFNLPFDLYLDHLSLFMCLVITGVGGLIVTYSVGYMSHENDSSYARFFCYMDLFIFSMLLLVLAGNFVFLVIGWGMVGVSSFLLIGFYYWRRSAVLAARKAFVMNVIGDIGMILAAFIFFVQFHVLTFAQTFGLAGSGLTDSGWLEAAAFLLLVGAVAKSAQLPLHTWLPDAMEGPTPVSALIHAATMVTAGVYLIGRMHPVFDIAHTAHDVAAGIGAASAIFAATIALVQTDIKRVLAYSTMSQIGYMFLAVGVGAYGAGFFHLLSHAFFKALLFMGAGNVIHSMNDEQDMRRYGGLWRHMRATSVMFLVGSLALVGIFPLVGFFSKELILGSAFSKPGTYPHVLWLVGFVTALLTGFYTGRMWWMAFWGAPSPNRPVERPHEAPMIMLVPVGVLAVLTLAGGALQTTALFPWSNRVQQFLEPVVGHPGWEGGFGDVVVSVATFVLAGLAFVLAYLFYVPREHRRSEHWDRQPHLAMTTLHPWSARMPGVQRFLEHKYYFDEMYNRFFVRSMDVSAVESERYVEHPLIDGAVGGVGTAMIEGAGGLGLVQNGFFRSYALVFVGGVVVAGGVVLWVATR